MIINLSGWGFNAGAGSTRSLAPCIKENVHLVCIVDDAGIAGVNAFWIEGNPFLWLKQIHYGCIIIQRSE